MTNNKNKITSMFIQNIPNSGKELDALRIKHNLGERSVQLCVFDTYYQGKSFITGLTVGEIVGNTPKSASPVAKAVSEYMLHEAFEQIGADFNLLVK